MTTEEMTADRWVSLLGGYVRPVPTPAGFTSREIVRRALEFDHPPRIPYSFIDPLESDFVELAVIQGSSEDIASVPRGEMVFDEWGVGRRSSGTSWGHAEVHPLADLSALDGYRFPEVVAPPARAAMAPSTALAATSMSPAIIAGIMSIPLGNTLSLISILYFGAMSFIYQTAP